MNCIAKHRNPAVISTELRGKKTFKLYGDAVCKILREAGSEPFIALDTWLQCLWWKWVAIKDLRENMRIFGSSMTLYNCSI